MQLSINNICKSINNIKILNNISININSGEIAILLGKSGSGKSTFLRILNNLENADYGKILLNNTELAKYDEKQISIIFQNFHLFSNLSVIENITLPLIKVKKINKEDALNIGYKFLKKYNLLDKQNNHIENLSGGQKQKIAIIRSLVMETKIICFDEPISSLDPYSTNEILTFIKELQKENRIIIMTTHNVHILDKLNATIYLLENGIIIESIKNTDISYSNNNSLTKKFINGSL